jgi:di/tricarboxylate transporter
VVVLSSSLPCPLPEILFVGDTIHEMRAKDSDFVTFEMGFVLFILCLMICALVFEISRPDIIVFFTIVTFLITGILTPEEALKGFSNEGMLTVALLFIVAGSIQKAGIADKLIKKLLRNKNTHNSALVHLLVPVAGFSAFLNNTPIVITLTPVIRHWCTERDISPSKFLIPLSYATILGGTITLIGTSTNLIVHGLMLDQGLVGFSMFQLGIVGIPVTIIGIAYILLFGNKLLPNHKVITELVNENSKEYLSEVLVTQDFPYINKTIEDAGLRQLKGLYLIEIIRENKKISPVKATTAIENGDRLIFTGLISTIAQLQKIKGLLVADRAEITLNSLKSGNTYLVEAVVSHQSGLLYSKIKETGFRSRYDAGVIAVHRNGERVKSKIGDIILKPGDTLLLLCGPDFHKRTKQSNDFYVVTPLGIPDDFTDERKGWLAIAALFSMILLVTFNVLSMFKAMALAITILITTRIISPEEAKNSIQFNILLLIAGSIGVGSALLKTGAAEWIAFHLISFGKPFGIVTIIFILYLLTNLFTEVISNSAAAVIMFPIGMEIAKELMIAPTAVGVTVAIAASASFITPIGYQTNLIVYGPGGYRFTDYLKLGGPLSIIVMFITVFIVNYIWI